MSFEGSCRAHLTVIGEQTWLAQTNTRTYKKGEKILQGIKNRGANWEKFSYLFSNPSILFSIPSISSSFFILVNVFCRNLLISRAFFVVLNISSLKPCLMTSFCSGEISTSRSIKPKILTHYPISRRIYCEPTNTDSSTSSLPNFSSFLVSLSMRSILSFRNSCHFSHFILLPYYFME